MRLFPIGSEPVASIEDEKSRRGGTPEGVPPRRLTFRRTPLAGLFFIWSPDELIIVRHGRRNAMDAGSEK